MTQAAETSPCFHIVLYEPDIPPNTGNIARLCAGTGAWLHLIEPLGFRLTSQSMKRAGLDYWDAVHVERHRNIAAFFEKFPLRRCFLLSTRGVTRYSEVHYEPGDVFIFGSETRGLPEELHQEFADHILTIPMRREAIRSMNLSNSVAIVLYEALRQTGFAG
ncbi:MAG: tRNA (cytidine(34)-2'-O)-methyltransferase [Spartobacteria bacterium]|nr:tRNA (cytidine(34)-2'-O)-methyltransferase [Spartobacteria bacterium]